MIETSQGISSIELEISTHIDGYSLRYCQLFYGAIRAPETPVLMDDHYRGVQGHGVSLRRVMLKEKQDGEKKHHEQR